jgi:hypothetical protein
VTGAARLMWRGVVGGGLPKCVRADIAAAGSDASMRVRWQNASPGEVSGRG